MKIDSYEKQGVVCFDLEGRLDAVTSEAAEKVILERVKGQNGSFLFNLEKLAYISSAGLRVLLATAKEIKRNQGRFVMCTPTPDVRNIFEISGFASFFAIVDSFDAGLQQLSA